VILKLGQERPCGVHPVPFGMLTRGEAGPTVKKFHHPETSRLERPLPGARGDRQVRLQVAAP